MIFDRASRDQIGNHSYLLSPNAPHPTEAMYISKYMINGVLILATHLS